MPDSESEGECARFSLKLVGVGNLQGKELYIELETDLAKNASRLSDKFKKQVELEFGATDQMVAFREYCEASRCLHTPARACMRLLAKRR